MRPRVLFGVVPAIAICTLFVPPVLEATVITAADGVCVEDAGDPFRRCLRWEGPDGFVVTDDITFVGPGEAFRDDWGVEFGAPVPDNSHMVFRRDDPFDLLSLDLDFSVGLCATPVEVRSSKGGFLLAEPDPGGPNTKCHVQREGPGGVILDPYPWAGGGGKDIRFAGGEWTDIDWFYVGLMPRWVSEEPRPRVTGFQVNSVTYVPEPATVWLLGGSTLIATWRARRQTRPKPRA